MINDIACEGFVAYLADGIVAVRQFAQPQQRARFATYPYITVMCPHHAVGAMVEGCRCVVQTAVGTQIS